MYHVKRVICRSAAVCPNHTTYILIKENQIISLMPCCMIIQVVACRPYPSGLSIFGLRSQRWQSSSESHSKHPGLCTSDVPSKCLWCSYLTKGRNHFMVLRAWMASYGPLSSHFSIIHLMAQLDSPTLKILVFQKGNHLWLSLHPKFEYLEVQTESYLTERQGQWPHSQRFTLQQSSEGVIQVLL